MKKVLATFSGKAFDESTKLISERAIPMGADELLVFDDSWLIGSGYYQTNKWLFEAKSRILDQGPEVQHGFAWCSWKAFIVLSAWDRMEKGDVCLYLDADTVPIAPFGQLFDQCSAEGGVMLFEEKCRTIRYTKAECFMVMGLPVTDTNMACGRFSMWQKGSFLARQMLAEWWAYSINPHCTLWGKSTLCQDQPEYERNSTEQSVLSNLAVKYHIPLHRGPDLWGEPQDGETKDVDLYPHSLFEQLWQRGDRRDVSGSAYRNV